MKKILLATTLLAASAGFASAEGVTVTGAARMGVISTNGGDAMFTSRVRIIFTGAGETDGGLSFGASVRNDQSGVGNTANGDSTVFISGAFGKLTMGDTGNAADALVGQVSGVGLTGLADRNEVDYLGKATTGALYEYSTGAFSAAVGLGQVAVVGGNTTAHKSIAVKYATDAYSVALGYEDIQAQAIVAGPPAIAAAPAANQLTLGASATFSGATVKAHIADLSTDANLSYALSVDYAVSGATLTAFYSDNSDHDGLAAYGIGASYDLGGGASVVGGVSRKDGASVVVGQESGTSYDLGVSMSF